MFLEIRSHDLLLGRVQIAFPDQENVVSAELRNDFLSEDDTKLFLLPLDDVSRLLE